jgi:hypothetical protein
MGQTAISCTDRREASPEARPHRLTLIEKSDSNCVRLVCNFDVPVSFLRIV